MSQLFASGGQSIGSFSFNISPSNEHPGLISFRMDWLGLLAVQGTVKRLLQHHRSKASILRRSAFFTVQLSHPYMTTGKTIALTRRQSNVSAFQYQDQFYAISNKVTELRVGKKSTRALHCKELSPLRYSRCKHKPSSILKR